MSTFVSGTYLAKTHEIDISVGCDLAHVCTITKFMHI